MSKTEAPQHSARCLSEGQRAYEARRAAKAGMTLEKWLTAKDRDAAEAARVAAKVRREAESKPAKPPGFLRRLIDRAHKPI